MSGAGDGLVALASRWVHIIPTNSPVSAKMRNISRDCRKIGAVFIADSLAIALPGRPRPWDRLFILRKVDKLPR